MRKLFKFSGIISLVLLCNTAFAQQNARLSILANQVAKVTTTTEAVVKVMAIDYYRDMPKAGTQYGQVYADNDVVIKLNGVVTKLNLYAFVQVEGTLLILEAGSPGQLKIKLNPAHKDKTIKTVDIDFKAPAEIGDNKDERDVKQAEVIFKNYGTKLSQEQYFSLAGCMDILAKNGKLTYDDKFVLNPASKVMLDKTCKTIDLCMWQPVNLKTLIDNNYFVLLDDGTINPGNKQMLEWAYYYQHSLMETSDYCKLLTDNLNNGTICSSTMNNIKYNYYDKGSRLLKPMGRNSSNKDTFIAGSRYILMVAWKATNFLSQPYIITKGDKKYYKSDNTFFNYPLFLASQSETAQWWKNPELNVDDNIKNRLRLMQLLGMPPTSTNDLYVEFWAKETDIFRPALDSSLGQNNQAYRMDSNYTQKYLGYFKGSFWGTNMMKQYPFGGCGYTYDWCPTNANHVGLNEFVVKEAREVMIRRAYLTTDYIKMIRAGK